MAAGSAVPLVLPCTGVAPNGARAAAVARRFAERGIAEMTSDVDEAVTAAEAGRKVVALDGCGGSCQARLLEARVAGRTRALNLEALAEAELGSPGELEGAAGEPVHVRPSAPLAGDLSAQPSHSLEDYLLALDHLTGPIGRCGALVELPTLASHVAQLLGVSRPSAGTMIARLERDGYLRRGSRKDLVFTPAGRAEADGVLRKQRILETFVVQTLGYGIDACYEEARRIAPGFDPAALERLLAALGRPESCPHGWPIDPEVSRRESAALTALSAVDGDVVVERLDETSRARVAALLRVGVEPGRLLSGVVSSLAAGVVSFAVGAGATAVGTTLADAVLVRAAG